MKIVPDTSVIIDGQISSRVDDGEFTDATVIVPEAVVGELEAQANDGRETGWEGLSELQRLVELDESGTISVEYVGRRPESVEKRDADEGDIDALIRDIAADRGATLITSDSVQAEVARSTGVEVTEFEPVTQEFDELAIEEFFDETTMSVHLKVGVAPMAKRGTVGEMSYEKLDDSPLTEDTVREYAADIEAATRANPEGFVELDEPGMMIVQFRDFRIAIAQPPFSDGVEITAVRPIVKTELEDYEYADELKDRLLERQRGVLIAGSPGAGKSTFAQAVAEFLTDADFAVKTMEKPRDLQVGPEITQYTALDGQMSKTADSLLMVRPDYTIYDEVRKTDDFEVFADMRLAGVGMVGVVHATRAIDALQRLIGRVELGLIPQVADTVIYIEAGEVAKVYDVTTEVKVPQGLMEEDLARPVIMIKDFETQRPEYEIYTFNRQVVTVPVGDEDDPDSGVDRIAKQEIEREIRAVAHGHVEVELRDQNTAIVWVEDGDISSVIGKGGGRISDIENRLGISIDVRTFEDRDTGSSSTAAAPETGSKSLTVQPEVTSRHVIVPMDGHAGETVEVQANGEYLFTATVSRGGEIQVSRGSAIAEELEKAIDHGKTITVSPS
ncbi:PINc/VapC family ATPase [Halobacteriaceae archaeon SHR40]|uniref:PINc/VapC family ATPase n=1 Tax=Halovenus amylolytica TaxID=2500550 RepID=UPI000FE3C2E5